VLLVLGVRLDHQPSPIVMATHSADQSLFSISVASTEHTITKNNNPLSVLQVLDGMMYQSLRMERRLLTAHIHTNGSPGFWAKQ